MADAIVVAWLPGTEAAGITDVLFGDVNPTGKLPHTWPRSMAQIPINQGDANYDPAVPVRLRPDVLGSRIPNSNAVPGGAYRWHIRALQ